VLERILPETMDMWKQKNLEYANVPFMFETIGELIEIVRKALKLRAMLYCGDDSQHEQPEEVAMDLVGHSLMLIYMLDPEKWDTSVKEH